MTTQPAKTARIHSLDSLRAIMMLLGIVLHSALTYGVIDYGDAWILKDPSATSLSNDFIQYLIHTFRIPIFFLISGFFGAMLFYERKPLKMIKNRIARIVLPFLVFLFVLWPTVALTFTYTILTFGGNIETLTGTSGSSPVLQLIIPQNTFHLWFLYYLILITATTVLLALLFKRLKIVTNFISKTFRWVIQKPLIRVLVFSGLTYLLYLLLGFTYVGSGSFIPDVNTFVFYCHFYVVGWVLYKSKHLLKCFMRFDWGCIIFGSIFAITQFFFYESLPHNVHILLNSFIVWLFIFGITGLFIRYGSKHSPLMRYISDSSYWVYLIHLSIVALIPALIFNWEVSATVKFLTVVVSTTLICYVSYHYLVRATFIGRFLNGRKYSRKISDISKAEKLSRFKTATD